MLFNSRPNSALLLRVSGRCCDRGGRFYYVTCSVLKEENDDVVAFALEQLPHCEPLALKVPGAVMTKYGYQVLPQTHAGDGLFFAGLVRTD